MSRRDNWMCSSRSLISSHIFIATIALSVLGSSSSNGGTFNWGDIYDPAGDVMYLNVEENNDESDALFAPNPGDGSPTVVGNQLVLDPQDFKSEPDPIVDLIDSTLTTVIMANPGASIKNILLQEFGDYTLGGLSGGEAFANVGAALFFTVLEVDNSPVELSPVPLNMTVSSGGGSNGGEFSRPGDDGIAAVIWSGSAFFDVDAYLAELQIDGAATKVRLRFDNTLSTGADENSSAFIKKKEAGIIITTNVPEPTAGVLAVLAVLGIAATRLKRSV